MGVKEDMAALRALKRKLDLMDARAGHIIPFTRYTKPDYEVNWHHRLTGKYLDKFLRKEIRFLMILEPPRHGKSELTSRRLPALIHGLFPNDEILGASYNAELATDMTVDVQRVMDQPEYKEIFPTVGITRAGGKTGYARSANEHEILPWQDPVSRLFEYHRGSYRSAGVGGSFTGRGGNWVLLDDLVKNRADADSPAFRRELKSFYRGAIRNRLEKGGSILLTQTCWHEDDLGGWIQREMKINPLFDQYVILRLPAIRDDVENDEDPRLLGEPLWPNKFDLLELQKLEVTSGTRDWNALYQQRPVAEGGNIIKRDKINFFKVVPSKFDIMISSWDFAVKDKESSDFAVGSVYGRLGVNIYLLAQVRGRWAFPLALDQVRLVTRTYPQATGKLVEPKAVGPAIVQTLKKEIQGFIEIEPAGDKVARLNAVSPLYEGGNVWYPDPSIAPWIEDHIAEIISFPAGAHDDRVDAESQALNYLRTKGPVYMPTAGHGSGTVY